MRPFHDINVWDMLDSTFFMFNGDFGQYQLQVYDWKITSELGGVAPNVMG
jgi:hypothetical protein